MQNASDRFHLILTLFAICCLAAASAFGQAIRFLDMTAAARIQPVDPAGYGHGTSFADYNGDGRPDLFALIYGTANFLYLNNGNGTFTDAAAEAGVQGADEHDRGTATADYDNDGDADIYVSCGYTGNLLFRNNGDATFVEVTWSAGVADHSQGQGVAWGDYDNDGWLDLLVCSSSRSNLLFHQNPNHTFTEVGEQAGLGQLGESAQAVFFDVDNDGDLDIFVSRGTGNSKLLYINDGKGGFSERAAAWGLADLTVEGGGVTIADYDRDGDMDIYLANANERPNRLYKNLGNRFENVAGHAGVANGDGMGLFADFDDDGWPDLYVFNVGPNQFYHNNGDGTFSAVPSAAGNDDDRTAHGAAVADYDGDGDLDIFFTNSGKDNTLLRNERPRRDEFGHPLNWLHVRLRGERSNRNGVGARLVAWTGGAKQTQVIIAGAGYVSGAYDLTAHFGLGIYPRVDSLVVFWPSGKRDRLPYIAPNQSVLVPEGLPAKYIFADTTRPKISGVAAKKAATRATISWQTDQKADSEVEFGLTPSYGSFSSFDTSLATLHSVTLAELTPNTTYHFRVRSKNAIGNLAVSGDFSFTTPWPATSLFTPFEIQLSSTRRYYTPYMDADVTGIFTSPSGKELRLNGYWNGGQTWRVRFSPNEVGLWKYRTESLDDELVTAGMFQALPSDRPGFVRVSRSRPYQFEYSNGMPFLLMGDTNWPAMSAGVGLENRFKPYINLRVAQHFNAFHSIVVPGGLEYGFNEGGEPFTRYNADLRDYNHLLPDFFQWVDRRVAYADSMGMVSILFFAWASEISHMSPEQYQRLALYIVSRYAAYNVFWILAGDYQAYFPEPAVYRQIGKAVAAADPFDHPISIHPADGLVNREFANEPWLSYVMHQLRDAGEFLADSIRTDRVYNKPVVNGEYGYHVPESVHTQHGIRNDANYIRTGAWSIFAAGGYFVAGFGRTFYDPDGHYGYDPGFDHPPMGWNLNYAPDLEMARQYSVLNRFFREQTNWSTLEPHPEMVADNETELLATPGIEYVAYKARGGRMRLRLPSNQSFSLSWFNPITGSSAASRPFKATAETVLIMPADTMDAVAVLRPTAPPPLAQLGQLANLQSEQLNIRQVRFRWNTPMAADSRIDLQKPSGAHVQFIDAAYSAQHEMIVDGLAPGIKYKITVSSQTAGGEWKIVTDCILTDVVVMDRYIEAEGMPTKTAGRAEGTAWNLDQNGYLSTTLDFPQSGVYRFEILARGEYRNKTWPQLALEIENTKTDTLTIDSAVFKWFSRQCDLTAGARKVKLAFVNASDDRQLILDQWHVQFIGEPATVAPVLTKPAVTNLTPTTATLSWKTDRPTTAHIEYGLSANYTLLAPVKSCRDTAHVFQLTGLLPNTKYYFRLRATDAAGKTAVSRDTTFMTLPALERLAIVSGDGQIGKPEKLLATPLVVKAFNTTGAAMPNVAVTFRVIAGGGKIIGANNCTTAECVVTTARDGAAAVSWELGKTDSQKVEVRAAERQDLSVHFKARIEVTAVIAHDDIALPTDLALRQHPNPFRDFTQFEIALPTAGRVSLKIFDLQGREVMTIFEGFKTAGRILLRWNGRDHHGKEVAAGAYFAVLRQSAEPSEKIFLEKKQILYLK